MGIINSTNNNCCSMERRLSCSKFLENEKWIEVQLEFVEKNISAHNAVGSTSS